MEVVRDATESPIRISGNLSLLWNARLEVYVYRNLLGSVAL
jgi:hypothetical protein